MANNVTNELTFKDCSKERFREILEAIQRDDIGLGSIDFHKIIPQPSFRTDKECIDWRIKNWNTKWEAYGYRDGVQYDEDKQQIRFLTANRSARKIILALSRQYAEIIEGKKFNLGHLTFDKDWDLNNPEVEKLIENIISYALLRDEYREQIKKAKTNS